MKVIIAGSRDITSLEDVEEAMDLFLSKDLPDELPGIEEIVSGGARGVDQLGERWAIKYGYSFKVFPAKWAEFGKYAGFYRNQEMGQYADVLVSVWNGKSSGTRHMIRYMQSLGKPVFVYNPIIKEFTRV